MKTVAVIGGGPAGLAAGEVMAGSGLCVTVYDAKPSVARKFLMAGKSGLNLTFDAPADDILANYGEASSWLRRSVQAFDKNAIMSWAEGLGQEMFAGSTGRVFPRSMKASPLLRAWLARLDDLGVIRKTRWRWAGWAEDALRFDTPVGPQTVRADAVVLAVGGASWARLGSDGIWADILSERGAALTPFAAANAAVAIDWSLYMADHMGAPIKGVAWYAGPYRSRGEASLSRRGLEGGGIYSVSRGVREGAALCVDLCPDLSVETVIERLSKPRGKTSLSNHMRKVLRLDRVKLALINEWGRPLPAEPAELAHLIKSLKAKHAGLRPIDEAISTAGGVPQTALNEHFMLHSMPGVFCAGEMLDWEAPTGGYLLTACLATGRHAGRGALSYLND
jgi:uncharacterized flavoprotein (TIGR03862 family)